MGGSSSSREEAASSLPTAAKAPAPPTSEKPNFTVETADKLQEAVDRIFNIAGRNLLGLEFSFSIADPLIEGCPLIGCSTGFTKLCGYELDEIVGRNCRFLVDAVPQEQIDKNMRKHTKHWCEAVTTGIEYRIPDSDIEPWMPTERPADEFLAMQRNARKDGSLFNNMFYLKAFNLGAELGKERPYIVALQSELLAGKEDLSVLARNLEQLDANMAKVKKEVAGLFFTQSAISRQLHPTQFVEKKPDEEPEAVAVAASMEAPANLHSAFPSSEVKPWDSGRFKQVRKVADATRNGGVVWLMQDQQNDQVVAVKQMPNTWMRGCHDEFLRAHPRESEMPWQDIGCTRFLNSVNYKYACNLEGVYRSDEHTFVTTSFASEGDLFSAAEAGQHPGPDRESAFAPLVVELFSALQQLHEMQVVHRDISLENVLRTKGADGKFTIKIIDYGMASTSRTFRNCPRGKASYEAPEMQTDGDYDAFLSDTFAVGVVVYCLLLKDYPWLSTKPGRCKCFEYVKAEGFRAYVAKRKVRGSSKRIADCISEPVMKLLEGMLAFDPSKRLTLGEKQWTDRRSVWDEVSSMMP